MKEKKGIHIGEVWWSKRRAKTNDGLSAKSLQVNGKSNIRVLYQQV